MNPFFFLYLGVGTDLLFTKEKIIVNVYSDSTAAYDNFEGTACNILDELGVPYQSLTLDERQTAVVNDMIDRGEDESKVLSYIFEYAKPETD
jgi:hypothetical protein